MIPRSPLQCKNRTAKNSSTTGKFSPCKAVPPVTDEQNDSATVPGAGDRPELLAQPGSPGWHARVSPMGGTRVSRGRRRADRPRHAPVFHENHVRLISAGGHWIERLPAPGGKNPAFRQSAGKLPPWRAAILCDGDADARQRRLVGGEG